MFTGPLIPPTDTTARTETWLLRIGAPAAIATLLIAGVPARLLMEVWTGFGYLFWVAAPVVFFTVAAALAQRGWATTPARCPGCRRLVRNGQTRCHRCGQTI